MWKMHSSIFLYISHGCAIPSKHLKEGHHRSASETTFEWRFAGGPLVARHCTLAGFVISGGRSWSCSRSIRSRRGVQITLHAKPEPTYLQSLQYRVEEVTRSSGSGNRRPGRRPAGTNPNRGRGRYGDRGGRHTFPLGPGEHPMSPNFQVRRDPETTSS